MYIIHTFFAFLCPNRSTDLEKKPSPTERLSLIAIIGAQLGEFLKAYWPSQHYCFEGFKGVGSVASLRDVSLSDNY